MKQFKDMTFVEKLQELKSTLQEVMEAENATLKMEFWVTISPETPKHFCNTACCIMGYQAIKEADRLDDIADHASWLSEILEDTNDITIRYLAQSIYFSSMNMRKDLARYSKLFSEEELDNISHLNKVNPSFQDAIDYLDICIEHFI